MKFSAAVFCLIVILGLYTVSAHPPLWVSPCRLACGAQQSKDHKHCFEPLRALHGNSTPEVRKQLWACTKPFEEAHKECVEACPNDMIRNPNLPRK